MGQISEWVSKTTRPSLSSIKSPTTASGNHFEKLAEAYLVEQGFVLVDTQYQCRSGEIDLIMTDSHVLVFIEVRYRQSEHYGSPADTVDRRKQRKVIKAAKHFLQCHKKFHRFDCRFDVVAITQSSGQPNINWIKNAFSEGFH